MFDLRKAEKTNNQRNLNFIDVIVAVLLIDHVDHLLRYSNTIQSTL